MNWLNIFLNPLSCIKTVIQETILYNFTHRGDWKNCLVTHKWQLEEYIYPLYSYRGKMNSGEKKITYY